MITAEQFSELYHRYRPVKLVTTKFFTADATVHDQWMTEDLAASGLTDMQMISVTDAMEKMQGDAQAAYRIAYWDVNGRPLKAMYRIRYKRPPFSKEKRYLQPNGEQLAAAGLPASVPYFHPGIHLLEGSNVICCEGEKKTAAVITHLGLPAFGIGGCQNWRDPDDHNKVHRYIVDLLTKRKATKLTIIPDGDVWRYDICAAYGGFAHAAEELGLEVEILVPEGKIDDLIVSGLRNLESLHRVGAADLVQLPDSLIDKYSLAFKQGPKTRQLHQNISNIHILMSNHPAFPPIWRNMDTNKVVMGEDDAESGNTEIGITRHFQHYFGMEKVSPQQITTVMGELSLRDKRSPFLDQIRSVEWDGHPRLETWQQRLWGVEDSEHVREVGLKWLVSSCARQDNPGAYVAWMYITIGPQKVGKTSMPRIFFGDLTKLVLGHIDDKDLKMLIHSGLCVNYDEMDSLGSWEMSKLKSMITNTCDTFRPPYGANTTDYPRRFVMYGCGNDNQFLRHDPSGQRRYGIVTTPRSLDFNMLLAERDQLWAEAWHVYKSGDCDYGNLKHADIEARRYESLDPRMESIQEWIHGIKANTKQNTGFVYDGKIMFTLADVCRFALRMERIPSGNDRSAKEIGMLCRSMFGDPVLTMKGPRGVAKYFLTDVTDS